MARRQRTHGAHRSALPGLYGLTVHDAACLELAQRLRLPLATLDRDLAKAARAAGVEVLP